MSKRRAWNKGLTKENSDSVRKVSEKKKEWWASDKHLETRKKTKEL